MSTKPTITEDGLEFDSSEELHFYWWLRELQQARIIDTIERAPTFTLADSASCIVQDSLFGKMKTREIMKGQAYTPDFYTTLHLNDHLNDHLNTLTKLGVFYISPDTHVASTHGNKPLFGHNGGELLWEVKGIAGNQAAAKAVSGQMRATQICRKWLWAVRRKWVNLVQIGPSEKCWFAQTFTPKRYLFTDKTRQPRTIKFPVRTLTEWLASAK